MPCWQIIPRFWQFTFTIIENKWIKSYLFKAPVRQRPFWCPYSIWYFKMDTCPTTRWSTNAKSCCLPPWSLRPQENWHCKSTKKPERYLHTLLIHSFVEVFLQFNDETMIPPYEIFKRKSVKTLVSPFFYYLTENILEKHNQHRVFFN